MADTAGQWHALTDCYGRHRRPVARSNLLLWPKPQAGHGTARRGQEERRRRVRVAAMESGAIPRRGAALENMRDGARHSHTICDSPSKGARLFIGKYFEFRTVKQKVRIIF